MKLLRYGPKGDEKPGTLDAEGRIRDLSGVVADITPEQLYGPALAALKAIDPTSLPLVEGQPRYGVPVKGSRKFIAIGLNFADHAAESNLPIPAEPVVFTKAITCLNGPNDDGIIPRGSEKTDWEVELGIVIGKPATYVTQDEALDHEVGDVQDLDMWLDLNGQRMQTGNTKTMIFGVAEIVSYLSEFMTLEPGDLITTGTPPGVGLGQKPPLYLKPGDTVRLGIQKLGEQGQTFVEWKR